MVVNVVSSDHALDWESQPGRVGIIGAGAIGCEFASMLADLGSEVHVFELMDQIVPGADADAAKELQKLLKRHGVKFNTGVVVESPLVTGERRHPQLGRREIRRGRHSARGCWSCPCDGRCRS